MRDKGSHVPLLLATTQTLKPYQMLAEAKPIVLTTTAISITLPTPIADLCYEEWNVMGTFATGSSTLLGTFIDGTSATINPKIIYKLRCVPTALNTYKWSLAQGNIGPVDFTPTLTWSAAAPDGLVVTAQYFKNGRKIDFWIHMSSADPGGAGAHLDAIAFPSGLYPADLGTAPIKFPVYGFHQKDTSGADTWTAMQAYLDVAAAADADRKIVVKNGVAYADNEATETYFAGSYYVK